MTVDKKKIEKEKTADMLKRIIGDYYLKIEDVKTEVEHKISNKEELKKLEWELKTFCEIYEIVIYNWEY